MTIETILEQLVSWDFKHSLPESNKVILKSAKDQIKLELFNESKTTTIANRIVKAINPYYSEREFLIAKQILKEELR